MRSLYDQSIGLSEDLEPEKFAGQIINYLEQNPSNLTLDLDGVANTRQCLQELISKQPVTI